MAAAAGQAETAAAVAMPGEGAMRLISSSSRRHLRRIISNAHTWISAGVPGARRAPGVSRARAVGVGAQGNRRSSAKEELAQVLTAHSARVVEQDGDPSMGILAKRHCRRTTWRSGGEDGRHRCRIDSNEPIGWAVTPPDRGWCAAGFRSAAGED